MKRIIIVGPGGLDAPLLGGVESGRFSHAALEDVGHVIHEDKPTDVAAIIHGFVDM